MSKIGKKPLEIPAGVEVTINGLQIHVKGPKGSLEISVSEDLVVQKEENLLKFSVKDEEKRNLRGLYRTLVANMVVGVSEGFQKKLLIMGVGYSAKVEGEKLVLSLGFAHKINYKIPHGITISLDQDAKGNTILTIDGISKELVGEVAAKIRSFKKPEPYKGKGIRYFDEFIKLKAGKSAKK